MKQNTKLWIIYMITTILCGATAVLPKPLLVKSADAGTSPTVVPSATSLFDNGGPFIEFPLTCPTNMELNEGPMWRGLTVGKSSVAELEDIYEVQLALDTPRYAGTFAPSYHILLTAKAGKERKLSPIVEVCAVRGRIGAIVLGVGDDEKLPSTELRDWLLLYGKPKIVTWTYLGNDWQSRTLVWPEKGVAVVVHILNDIRVDPSAVMVNEVGFFPFAKGDNYLAKWPYSGLQKSPPSTQNDDASVADENPFNFDAILGTPVPQPSNTPTVFLIPAR